LDFLKGESAKDFETDTLKGRLKENVEDIPLVLSDNALKRLKSDLSDYPEIYRSGITARPNYEKPNFLYLVGQFLSVIAVKMDYLEILHEGKNLKEISKDLYKVWESRSKMNAGSLFSHMAGKSNEEAKKELIELLSESYEISKGVKKILIPEKVYSYDLLPV